MFLKIFFWKDRTKEICTLKQVTTPLTCCFHKRKFFVSSLRLIGCAKVVETWVLEWEGASCKDAMAGYWVHYSEALDTILQM